MAYTGIAMLIGDKFDIFHKYVEEIMRRPVFSHEFATCAEEIKERAKPDFLKLCAEEEKRPHGEWIEKTGMRPPEDKGVKFCSNCMSRQPRDFITHKPIEPDFCPNCGADMRKEGEEE